MLRFECMRICMQSVGLHQAVDAEGLVGRSAHRPKVAAVPDERRNQTQSALTQACPRTQSDTIRRNQHALSMHSACTQHALSMHSACTPHALSMHSACNQHAISAPELARRSGHQQALVDPVPNAAALQDAPLADHLMRDAIRRKIRRTQTAISGHQRTCQYSPNPPS